MAASATISMPLVMAVVNGNHATYWQKMIGRAPSTHERDEGGGTTGAICTCKGLHARQRWDARGGGLSASTNRTQTAYARNADAKHYRDEDPPS
eukprot:6211795-Pleurochrysis_carterae.AAC.2